MTKHEYNFWSTIPLQRLSSRLCFLFTCDLHLHQRASIVTLAVAGTAWTTSGTVVVAAAMAAEAAAIAEKWDLGIGGNYPSAGTLDV